jgi:hypothetical protein
MSTQTHTPNGKHDVITHRIVVACIGATVLLTGAAIATLAALGLDVPPSLPAFGGTALGALTGMLVNIMKN